MTRSSCVWSASGNSRFPSKDGYPFLFHSSGVGLLNPFNSEKRKEIQRGPSGVPGEPQEQEILKLP
jgi:hypothetical protein